MGSSLLGATFLAAKAEHALCHSWRAVLSNCLFSTTSSSISLLTAPLQTENANKDNMRMPDFWKAHRIRHCTEQAFSNAEAEAVAQNSCMPF